jgi:hypothetical protein
MQNAPGPHAFSFALVASGVTGPPFPDDGPPIPNTTADHWLTVVI